MDKPLPPEKPINFDESHDAETMAALNLQDTLRFVAGNARTMRNEHKSEAVKENLAATRRFL